MKMNLLAQITPTSLPQERFIHIEFFKKLGYLSHKAKRIF